MDYLIERLAALTGCGDGQAILRSLRFNVSQIRFCMSGRLLPLQLI